MRSCYLFIDLAQDSSVLQENNCYMFFLLFWQGLKESVTVKSLIMTVMMELVWFQVLLSKFILLSSLEFFLVYNLLLWNLYWFSGEK